MCGRFTASSHLILPHNANKRATTTIVDILNIFRLCIFLIVILRTYFTLTEYYEDT